MIEEATRVEYDNNNIHLLILRPRPDSNTLIYYLNSGDKCIFEIVIRDYKFILNYLIDKSKYNITTHGEYYYQQIIEPNENFNFEYIIDNKYDLNLILRHISNKNNILKEYKEISLNWRSFYFENDYVYKLTKEIISIDAHAKVEFHKEYHEKMRMGPASGYRAYLVNILNEKFNIHFK